MYDLTVEDVHTFAVGDGDWVVHNCTFAPDVEDFIALHINKYGPPGDARRRAAQTLINEMAGGFEQQYINEPRLGIDDLTPEHIEALMWQQAVHLGKSVRGQVGNERFAPGVIGQFALARYRFLAAPQFAAQLRIERLAIAHPDISDSVRQQLTNNLNQVLALFGSN